MRNSAHGGRQAATDELDMFDEVEQGSSESQIDIQDYLRMVRKHKWPITLFTAVITALAAYYAYTTTPIYASKAVLLVEEQKANLVSIEELYGVDSNKSDYYLTQFELLKSRGLAKKVIDRLGLATHYQFAGHDEETPSAEATEQSSLVNQATGFISGLLPSGDNSAETSQSESSDLTVSGIQSTGGLTVSGVEGGAIVSPVSTGDYSSMNAELEEPIIESEQDSRNIQKFLANLEILPIRNTKLVQIVFNSPDPVLAATVANTVAEQYITSYLDSKMDRTEKASAWLAERVASLKQTLDESEQRLQQFKVANGLVDVNGSVGRLNEQQLLLATTELATARSELATAADLYRDVEALRTSAPEALDTIPAVQNDPLVRAVKIEQGQRQRELDELSNRYGARHPKIVDAESNLASLNVSLQGHIDRVVGTIEKDYRLLEQRVASIQRTLAVGKQEIQDIGSKKFELDALDREVQTNRDLYNTYFSRLTETRSADGLEVANATVTERAERSLNPVKPNKQLIIVLAAMGSLVLSMLMAFLYEQLDETIKSTKDIEKKLGVKLIGILPLIKTGMFGRRKTVPVNPATLEDTRGTFAEAVNTARTVLSVDGMKGDAKVLLVTSSVPGEGKSTTSLNLAYSMSHIERVLLIDCDLRRPSLAKSLGDINAEPGLTNLITRTSPPKDCIRRKVIGELDIMFSGTIPQQPLELISSERLKSIVNSLRGVYDKIVIDCAPTQAVSDALVLSQLADSVVFCVKSHDTSFEVVKRSMQRLRQVNAPLAGVIMTQVDMDKLATYGGDHYYQGYYDYYGYSDKELGNAAGGKLSLTQAELQEIKADKGDDDLDMSEFVGGKGYNSASSADYADGTADEFDMTTRLEEQPSGASSRRATGVRRDRDDLDIL